MKDNSKIILFTIIGLVIGFIVGWLIFGLASTTGNAKSTLNNPQIDLAVGGCCAAAADDLFGCYETCEYVRLCMMTCDNQYRGTFNYCCAGVESGNPLD